jgi:hypothetical protein
VRWSPPGGTTVIGSCGGVGSPTTCGFSSGVWPARPDLGLLPPERRAQEGRGRDFDDEHPTNPG